LVILSRRPPARKPNRPFSAFSGGDVDKADEDEEDEDVT
jgi:hypothetical protein